jgi:hypothetical protein
MRRFLLIGFYLCIASVFAQILAPASVLAMDRAVDPFTIICSHDAADAGSKPFDTHHHDHQHCGLCHVFVGGLTLGGRPTFTAFDYPIASPLRWTVVDTGTRLERDGTTAQPRGPPASI